MPDALLDPLLKTLSIMSLELRGSLLAAQGKTDDAKAFFASAAREEKALGYREPPNYIRPVGETEGAAMLAARKWADAKAAFERALVGAPALRIRPVWHRSREANSRAIAMPRSNRMRIS